MREHQDHDETSDDETSDGGDPVCWLERVCQECGALVIAELPAACWRCGTPVVPS